MKVKPNVNIGGACFEIGWACAVADELHGQLFKKEMVVTSVRDGEHNPGSLHPLGKAADIRTRDLTAGERTSFYSTLRMHLSLCGFDVVLEADHIHIEFDPKPGVKFAEVTT